VATIAQSIEAMAAYARRRPGAHPRQWAVHFRPDRLRDPPSFGTDLDAPAPRHTLHYGWEPHRYTVTIDDHVWSPGAYVALALSRIEGIPRTQAASPLVLDEDFLTTLTESRVPLLQEENQLLSDALERDMLDPHLHEQAALLLGALALREEAEALTDERYILSRLAAHLAFARGLRDGRESGLSGRFAEAILLTLVGRQKDAVDGLRRLESHRTSASTRGIEAWCRALTLRSTGDWRQNKGSAATPLEQVEEFRALRIRLSPEAARRYLDGIEAGHDTAWHRVIFRRPPSVDDCGHLAHAAVPLEIEEMEAVWAGFGETAPTHDTRLVAALNEPPAIGGVSHIGDRMRFRVLDRGLWAAFLQRHLGGAILATHDCYAYRWGMTEAAAHYSNETRERFSNLTLFPFVATRLTQDDKTSAVGVASAAQALKTAPEVASAAIWLGIREAGRKLAPRQVAIPDLGLWFSPPFPRNTVYDSPGRLRELDALKLPTLDQGAVWRELAPYNAFVNWSYLWQRHMGQGPAAEMMRDSALFVDYDGWMLARVVENALERVGADPVTYKDAAVRLCRVDPEYWSDFGFQLVRLGAFTGAAEAFRSMVEQSRNAVGVSNSLGWLVLYELDQGRREEAHRLAAKAAGVYSASGLATMGVFLEKTGQYDRALEYFRKVVERYESRSGFAAFYLRNEGRFRGTPVERQFKSVVDEVFPHGIEVLDRSSMNGPPQHGLRVEGNPWDVRKAGLLVGDVIAGVNGKHARTWEQYSAILRLNPPSHVPRKMKLVLWRNDRYVEQEIYPSDGFSIRPYP
jgi:tetratricopeptide (TPR) repeat protein